jgi:hypothetical protein
MRGVRPILHSQMANPLPPDLARLGDDLTGAAERHLAGRRRRSEHRRRLAITGVFGALAFAALTPAALDPADRQLGPLSAAAPASDCEHRSEKFRPACEPAMVLYRPYAVR